jgi:hypothetical protein
VQQRCIYENAGDVLCPARGSVSHSVGVVTVRQLETAIQEPRRATLELVRRALEAAGIEFIDANGGGEGVRLRKSPTR